MVYLCGGNSAITDKNQTIMIYYKKYQNHLAGHPQYNKWYGRATHQLVDFDDFITHMANHHCPFSEATIRGVLIEAETCLRELLLDGRAVKFGDLGIFRVGLCTSGENTAKEFTAASIKGVRMNLYLGRRFRAASLYKEARFAECGKYAGFDEEPADGEQAAKEE